MSMPYANLPKNKVFANLISCLEEINDFRMPNKIKYPLVSIVLMALCAIIGGADNWVEVASFCKDHVAWFRNALGLECGVPSHDTFNRVFNQTIPNELTYWLILWLEATLPQSNTADVIHMDGKVL